MRDDMDSYQPGTSKDLPTADHTRCYDCSVLPGRDHLDRCNSPAARRQRQEWLKDSAKEQEENPDRLDYPTE